MVRGRQRPRDGQAPAGQARALLCVEPQYWALLRLTSRIVGGADPPYVVGEPVAGNYYPVNSLISLDDGTTEMAVVTDVSMGGARGSG